MKSPAKQPTGKRRLGDGTASAGKRHAPGVPAKTEAAREWFKNWWRPTHQAALNKLQDGPPGRSEPINADDCPDVPEMMEVIAEVGRLAREGYDEACEQYGKEWWDEHVERFERYPLVYGLSRAGEADVQSDLASVLRDLGMYDEVYPILESQDLTKLEDLRQVSRSELRALGLTLGKAVQLQRRIHS